MPSEAGGARRDARRDARWVSDHRARQLTVVARWWAPVAVAALVAGAWLLGIPSNGEFGFAETLVQVALLVGYGVGYLLSLRWAMTGATTMAVTAVGVGALSAVQYHPRQAFLVATALYLPAGMLWLAWQRRRSRLAVAVLAGGLALLLVGGAVASSRIFDYFYGPKAPVSATQPLAEDLVEWMWAGGLASDSAVVVAAVTEGGTRDQPVRLAYNASGAPTLDSPSVPGVVSPDAELVYRFELSGLEPATSYDYAVVVGDSLDTTRGSGRLLTPEEGAYSFRFTFASCALLGSNAATYDAIAAADPLFHLVTGDFFYADIATDAVSAYRRAYDTHLTPGAPAALWRQVPVAYMWDDHDYGPNDADRTSPSRDAAWASYRAFVPHYPLLERTSAGPVYQAFTIGRVRFIVTDLRSERDPKTEPDDAGKSMMGAEQRAWFERELLRADRRYPLVVWVSSVPWIDTSASPGDDWGSYTTERAAIAEFVSAHGIDHLVMLAGDAHMIAADDGSNSDFSRTGGGGFPVLHAAPLDQHISIKGGPYSEGVVAEPGQFGLVTIDDDGHRLVVTFEGRSWAGETVLTYRWLPPR